MKRARFSEEQIIGVRKEAEAGAKVSELCRRHGISDATFYTWRSKYGGLEISRCVGCGRLITNASRAVSGRRVVAVKTPCDDGGDAKRLSHLRVRLVAWT